ncbi:MAG TPA: hypothetical protein VIK30_08865 [Polyangia bacterium]
MSGGSSFTKLSLTGIAVTNGTCDVGASTTSGTVMLDDFTLIKG